MEYKGYVAHVEFDDDAGIFHGNVLHIADTITFQGTTVDGLRHEFAVSVDDYLAFCEGRNEEPEKPYSGRMLLRIDPTLHRAVAVKAQRSGQSINAFIASTLAAAAS